MADVSINEARPHRGRHHDRFEYRIYVALIFLLALPFALVGYVWAFVRDAQAPAQGPIARARAEAHGIAPMIFRA